MKNNKVLQVGITGGIGSGKSMVCKAFHAIGIPTYDADSSAKWLMNHDEILKAQIIEAFGIGAYDSTGDLDRLYMREKAFSSKDATEILNKLVHPRVGLHYADWVSENEIAPYLIKEAALMFESGSHLALHCVVTVQAPLPIRIQRVLNRDPNRSSAQVEAILERQMTDEQRESASDFCLLNSGEIPLLPQILNLHHQFSDTSLQLHYGVLRQTAH